MDIKDAIAWARLEPPHTAQGAVFHALLAHIEELENPPSDSPDDDDHHEGSIAVGDD